LSFCNEVVAALYKGVRFKGGLPFPESENPPQLGSAPAFIRIPAISTFLTFCNGLLEPS